MQRIAEILAKLGPGRLVALAAALVAAAWIIWAAASNRAHPMPLNELSAASLVNDRLPQRIHDAGVWQELHRRLRSGGLPGDAVDRSVAVLAEQAATLGWEEWLDAVRTAQPYLDDVLTSDGLTPATSLAFHRAFFGKPPRILPLDDEAARNGRLTVEVHAGNAWRLSPHLRYAAVFDVTGVTLDGAPFEPDRVRHNADLWSGRKRGEFGAGPYRIEVEVVAALVDRAHTDGRNTLALPRGDWPATVVEWRAEATTR